MFAHSEDHRQYCGRRLRVSARAYSLSHRKPLGAEKPVGSRSGHTNCAGFSLLELLVSIAVLLVISGGVLSVISFYQKSFARTEVRSDMYENVRGVAELMTQEIGQAGLVSLPSTTLASAVAAGTATAQTVNVSSTTSMFVGEQVLVDAGPNEELVTIAAVTATTIKAIFANAHLIGVPISAMGVFPSGIVPPGTADGSTANVLNIFGDINADGSLVYVRYTCTPGTSAAPGTLTRSVTTIVPGVNTIGASQTLLSTVIPNPGGGTVCFQYTTLPAAGYNFVTNVGFTLSVQATRPDPTTLQYSQMTKSFLNLAPRNVLAGYEAATASSPLLTRLQPALPATAPANVLLY